MKRKILITVLAVICALCAAFAFGCAPDSKTYYTVTFMDGQTRIGEPVQVEKGKKIAEYPTPSRSDENYIFDNWYKDEELTKVWNPEVERVTGDVTLYANFLYVSAAPGNAVMSADAFSNTLTWLQRGITPETQFSVELYGGVKISKDGYAYESDARYTETGLSGAAGTLKLEKYLGREGVYTVSWTPAEKPSGGIYAANIVCGELKNRAEGLAFKGAGTEANPYLVSSATDLAAVNTANVGKDAYYKVAQSFKAKLSYRDVVGNTFDGNFDGNGKTITLESSDCGIFGTLGTNAVVEDLAIAGSVANVQINCAAAIAAVNRGKILYCSVAANLDSAVGTVGTLEGGKDGITGGAAGVAGINYGEISHCVYSGQIKSNVGAAGIASVNNGIVSLCSLTGTLGAANSVETGNSSKAYSYMGGIVAVNYATVEKSSTTGSGKLLAQRGSEGTNDYVGGIVGYNAAGATVSECSYDGIRVHGNRNVGGIAGANAGTVTHCYAGGTYHSGSKDHSYVGGLAEVGGIVGLSEAGGSVKNCFSTSNIYAYSGNAYKVAKNSVDSIYLGGNLNSRDGIAAVSAPEGTGNVLVELDDGDYSTKNYPLILTQEQLDALNGDKTAFGNLTAVRLACESISKVKPHTVSIVIDGNAAGTVNSVEGNKISLKQFAPEAPDGKYLAGWALIEGGEVAFDAAAQIGYSDLEEYDVTEIRLYPVIVEGERPQITELSVAVWTRYFSEDTAKALFEAYKTSEYFKDGWTVVYTPLDSNNNNNFKTDYDNGDFNVVLAYKAATVGEWQKANVSINAYNENAVKFDTMYVGLNHGDDVVVNFGEFLGSDVAKKIMNPAYVTEAEADTIEITLMNGATQYGDKLTVSNATEAKKIALPKLSDGEDNTFLGWATAETDGEVIAAGEKAYADLEAYASEGKLTLHARFSEGEDPQTKILNIAFYGKFVYESTAEALMEAFNASENAQRLTASGVTIKYTIISSASGIGNNNANFIKTVKAGDKDGNVYDIAFGYKATKSDAVDMGQAENISISVINANGNPPAEDNRHVGVLTADSSTSEFTEFLKTDTAKEIMLRTNAA